MAPRPGRAALSRPRLSSGPIPVTETRPRSARAELPLERWGRAVLRALQTRADRTAAGRFAFEVLMFGLKQGWACLFGASMLVLLLGTHLFWPKDAPLHRYDAVFLGAAAIQTAMLAFRLEDRREAVAILVFHLVGTVMELFKTAQGSWTYPEAAVFRLSGVPLFSGFMYASVGSYLARVWRIQAFRFTGYPPAWETWVLAAAIYLNFFTHHVLPDARLALFAATAWVFRRTWVIHRPDRRDRRMPLLLGFGLVSLFIWFAENLATFSRAWIYPSQRAGWTLVGPEKLGSWLLLMIISFVLVAAVQRRQAAKGREA